MRGITSVAKKAFTFYYFLDEPDFGVTEYSFTFQYVSIISFFPNFSRKRCRLFTFQYVSIISIADMT